MSSLFPITYVPGFIADPAAVYARLWGEMPWQRREDAPRREAWMNDFGRPYTYGRGRGMRTYEASPWHEVPKSIRGCLLAEIGARSGWSAPLEGCFSNGYEGPRDHLGWHADDDPGIDHTRPIAVVSLGSARRIQFRAVAAPEAVESLVLEPGSLLLMGAGMQATHEHRIPKHGAECGPRISLTYRGLRG